MHGWLKAICVPTVQPPARSIHMPSWTLDLDARARRASSGTHLPTGAVHATGTAMSLNSP